ncbi:MAG: type II toxin-antitoxin system Phd/YefM family antitoxin [Chthoniobacteraceae bacterium]
MVKTELVTTLKRNATKIISSLKRGQEPVLITQHGLPAAYLVDVETYEGLQSRIEVLEGIARGEMAIRDGRVLTHAQAKSRMKRWLK